MRIVSSSALAAALLAALVGPTALAAELAAPAAPTFAGVQVAQAAAAGTRNLRSTEFGFRLAHPADWTPAQPADPTVKAVLHSPPGANLASCMIIQREVDEYWGLTQEQLDWGMRNHPTYDAQLTEGLPANFANVEVRDNVGARIGNIPARMGTIAATDTRAQQQTVMIMFLARTPPGRVWHITCAATGADQRAADAAFAARRIDFLRLFSTFYWER
jgi:hypothetical protein